MDMSKKRVLIVDDDSKSRRIFEAHLNSMGLETVLANNGEEAMEILAGDPYFDLIITDVMMPYLTGFDFTKKLKEYKETKYIPVIATSAFHD
ncbi:MAG: response regulator [Nitrospirota bacterium]